MSPPVALRAPEEAGRVNPPSGAVAVLEGRAGAGLGRSKPLRRSDPPDPDPEYDEAREFVSRRDRGECYAPKLARTLPPEDVPFTMECSGRRDPHHVWKTTEGGPKSDPENIITLCRRHHDWVHTARNRTAALALGLLREAA